ncbi:MAG: hypothetical protein RR635_10480, partial [Oscillospiraceae bacterium]
SSNKDSSLMKAIEYLLSCENKKSDYIDASVDLSFASEKWRKFVIIKNNKTEVFCIVMKYCNAPMDKRLTNAQFLKMAAEYLRLNK